MSLNDVATALGAVAGVTASVSGGQLTVGASAAGTRLAFAADTSGVLAALGVNGFFSGDDARTVALAAEIAADPGRIAAARVDLASGVVSPGDGRNGTALAAIGQDLAFLGATQTPAGYLGALGAAVGSASRAARGRADALESVMQSLEAQRQSVSGVNVDEELADMVRFQHAYEASAKFISTIDAMIRSLLAMV
jgi:flagellar hook-associated protein 1 FlgK